MKLLTPEQLKVTPVFFDSDNSNAAKRTVRWILLVNRVVTPVNMVVACNAIIQSVSISPIGAKVSLQSGSSRLGPTTWQSEIDSPVWGPTAPFLATVLYRGSEEIVCSFNPR
jgi:hypothetical protein